MICKYIITVLCYILNQVETFNKMLVIVNVMFNVYFCSII